MKKFLISIDTEGDNLWDWDEKSPIGTLNSSYLPRFQELCDRYGFKPTYLSNWEMVSNPKFCQMVGEWASENRCEVGMHLHAWNTPPVCELDVDVNDNPGLPYLIEYPDEVMEAKVDAITLAIERNIGIRPVTHRAGRWAMDSRYFNLLARKGYLCDCSVTPHIDWKTSPGRTRGVFGTNYSSAQEEPYPVNCGKETLIEIPLTVRETHALISPSASGAKPLARSFLNVARGQSLQLRPNGRNLNELLWLVDHVENSSSGYLMFMLHSSEFMPGGSPTFRTEEDIERLYEHLDRVFDRVSRGFTGMTIGDYAREVSFGEVVR